MVRRPPPLKGEPPKAFRVARDLPLGRHPLLAAFPGLGELETAVRLAPDPAERVRLFDETCVEVIAEDAWMYIAPWEIPREARGRWKPVVTPRGSDCVVIGGSHLRESPALILFLDIFHELCHLLQRRGGRELWDSHYSYVERPTEVEAYRFVVDEARRLGVGDPVLRDYLKVEWIDEADFHRLLGAVGVSRG
ncbi:MAG TPA: hypothetical protein VMH78_08250 [Thermoplasmata archaeon]|nr:hypothetical protein [Thermoplasmata archaeon]